MAPHASHARAEGLPTGATWHRGRRHRRWDQAAREIVRRVWVPLWFAAAIGITWAAVELVTKGVPVVSIGGP